MRIKKEQRWAWVVVLGINGLGSVEDFSLGPHRKGRCSSFFYFCFCFKMVPPHSWDICSLSMIAIELNILSLCFFTCRPFLKLFPLPFSRFSSKLPCIWYLPLPGLEANSFVKSDFFPDPMLIPEYCLDSDFDPYELIGHLNLAGITWWQG